MKQLDANDVGARPGDGPMFARRRMPDPSNGRRIVLTAALAAVAIIGATACQPRAIDTDPGIVMPRPPSVSVSPIPQQHLLGLQTGISRHEARLDASTPHGQFGHTYPPVTAHCATPRKVIETGEFKPGETLLSGGYSTSGSVYVRDSFPSDGFGRPVADGNPSFAWTVVFATDSVVTSDDAGTVWVNCAADPLGTSVYSAKIGQELVRAQCPDDRQLTGGGFRSGWDETTFRPSRILASYPDPDHANGWIVYEYPATANDIGSGGSRFVGAAYAVCANSGVTTTVITGPTLDLPPDPKPTCTPGGIFVSACTEHRVGHMVVTCSTGRLTSASVISLMDGIEQSDRAGFHVTVTMPVAPTGLPTAPGAATGKPSWAMTVRINRAMRSLNDPALNAPMSLRTEMLCAM